MGNAKVYLKQALFVLVVIAAAKFTQTALKLDQNSGIGLYLP